jgi:hypothetical protein
LEKETERTVKQEIENTINKTRALGTDISGSAKVYTADTPGMGDAQAAVGRAIQGH